MGWTSTTALTYSILSDGQRAFESPASSTGSVHQKGTELVLDTQALNERETLPNIHLKPRAPSSADAAISHVR